MQLMKLTLQIDSSHSIRSEVVYFVQMFVIFSLMTRCIIKLAFSSSTCEEIFEWISILSSLVGFFCPTRDYEETYFNKTQGFRGCCGTLWLFPEKRN